MVRQKINVVGVVGNDAAWQQIRGGQIQLYGEERAVGDRLQFTRYDRVGGGRGGPRRVRGTPAGPAPGVGTRAVGEGSRLSSTSRSGPADYRKGCAFHLTVSEEAGWARVCGPRLGVRG